MLFRSSLPSLQSNCTLSRGSCSKGGTPAAQRPTHATELLVKLASSAPHTLTDRSDETAKHGGKDATDGFQATQPHALGWTIKEKNQKLGLTLLVASTAAPCSKSSAAVLLWPLVAAQKRGVQPDCAAQIATFTPGSLGKQAFNVSQWREPEEEWWNANRTAGHKRN